jgi:EAL domain-containing protein (putative c-di-GMP-specific phosphodiesterase class I)/ActR/RegA family two-component response regulator
MTGHRLLIIDDEPSIGAVIARVATSVGYQTMVVQNADDFLLKVRSWAPTHIVMDLQMPVVDGLQLLSELASDNCTASIILVSGVGDSVINAARRVGAARGLNVTAALTKPFSAAELAGILKSNRMEDPWLTVANFSAAMNREEFYLLYQPKVELRTGRVSGAESSACIDRMTNWIGSTACGQLRAWDDLGCRIDLAINVSARNLHEARLADQLEAQCRVAGVEPARITLELTETAAMRDAVQMMDVLTRLRVKGFSLAIDDFGTGYSSLVQLHRLPFSEIKIDRTFVTGCTTSSESRSIVRLVIELAHALGMKAVAEGVETADAVRMLRDMGCDEAQGSFIASPLDATDVPAAVLEHAASEWYRTSGPWAPPLPSAV